MLNALVQAIADAVEDHGMVMVEPRDRQQGVEPYQAPSGLRIAVRWPGITVLVRGVQ